MWTSVLMWSTALIILSTWPSIACWNSDTRASRSHEKTCIFPSVHRRAAIYECQHSSWSVPTEHFHSRKPIWWCPLTDNFDHYPEWMHCPETASTYGGNEPGHACHFPFVYQKQIHTTCIRNGGDLVYNHSDDPVPIDTGQSGYWWCSTTANFDRDRKWTRCRPQLAQQLPCHFPKRSTWAGGMVNGIAYECQAFAGHWICMTELGQLRECPTTNQSPNAISTPLTEGGNSPGRACHFPFQATLLLLTKQLSWTEPARKRNFTTCLPGTPNSPLAGVLYPPWIGFWCATTDNFDRDRLWTRCVLEPDQLTASASAVTTTIGVLPQHSITTSLAEVWTQLSWFQQMCTEERQRLASRTHAFSPEFEQSLRVVESKRAQWDVTQSDSRPSWWIWLAPFWWAVYGANQTPVTTTPTNQYLTESTTETHNAVGVVSPLTRGFQLPSWVDSWSSAGWLEFGLSMNDRWQSLVANVHLRWHKAWLIAYLTGFASAVGILFGMILIVILCLDETKRKQLVHTICGPRKLKRPPSNLVPIMEESQYLMYTPINGMGSTKYPCTVADEYCPHGRGPPQSESVEPEVNKNRKFSRQDEGFLMNDNNLWCSLNPNAEMLAQKRNSPRQSRNGHSHGTDLAYESAHAKPDCFRRAESTCPCWPVRDLNCLRYQQQLNHALELIVNLIRTNENLDELYKSADLRAQLQQLISDRPVSSVSDSMCTTTQLSLLRGKSSGCDCTPSHGNSCSERVLPSAPPPSYEQVTD